MGMRINLNTAAMTASRNLAATNDSMSKSIERLSSGFKINRAGDDPAGLVISEKLRAQVSGIGQAIKNAGDAVNMVKTAEGAMGEVNNLLRSMRDLAVHAANTGANDGVATQADQAQIKSAIDSINKIATETQFGSKRLLDGSAGIKTTITGSNVLSANLSNANITADQTGIDISTTGGSTQAAAKATLTGTADITADLTGKSITINGVKVDFTATAAGQANTIISDINKKSSETGVIASNDGSGHLVLTQKEYGSASRIDVTGGTDAYGAASAAAIGKDVKATVQVGGTDISDALWDKGSGLVLKDSLGNAIQMTESAGNTAAAYNDQLNATAGTLTFQVGAYKDQTRSLNIASVSASTLGAANGTSVTSVADIDVTVDAQAAIAVLDKAISDVSSQRASLGSIQKNVLESSINSLGVAKENLAASESSIRDTDMAAEMVEFTRTQIMNQAGVSMLSQANQAPQQLLSLLR